MTSNATGHEAVVVMESKIPTETHRFTWNVANFVQVRNSKELVDMLGVTFGMGRKIGLPVTFQASLQLHDDEDKGWIGWYLSLIKVPEGVEKAMVQTAVKIGTYKNLADDDPVKYVVGTKKAVWGWGRVIHLPDDVSNLPLDANGALPIEIEVTLFNAEGTKVTVPDVTDKFQGRFLQKLSEDMKTLYENPTAFSTSGTPAVVSVVSKDGRKISSIATHLAARSPVFRTMFQTPMTEAKEGVVKMEDIGGEALEVFLHFMHTATLKKNWKEPVVLAELPYAAHKYLMQDLLEFLDEAIGLVCAPAHCLNMIRLARSLELKKATRSLLIMYQDQWKEATGTEEMISLLQE